MTPRTVTSYGLIAGVGYTEMRTLAPGLLCDLYVLRMRYDDQQHGLKRKEKKNPLRAGLE